MAISNPRSYNPEWLDIEPQKFFTANRHAWTTGCSHLNPFVRYDAYVTGPTDHNEVNARLEPIPDAENPGAVTSPLKSAHALSVADDLSFLAQPR